MNDYRKKLIYTTVATLIQQIVAIVAGFVLPKVMLVYFGSSTNGLVASISQFLGFISFMQAGVAAVAQAAWYKPLADNDIETVSKIYVSAQRFFRKIAYIFVAYTIVLAFSYPRCINTGYSNLYVFFLVVLISLNLFCQYYFGITNSTLLYADQKGYISALFSMITQIFTVVLSVWLIIAEADILTVKLFASVAGMAQSIGLAIYVRRKYKIHYRIKYEKDPIVDKWSGFIQHISSVVMENTDVIVLTMFSTLSNVSVYSIYNMIVAAMRNLTVSASNGIQALMGNLLVRNDYVDLNNVFTKLEIFMGYVVSIGMSCTMCLIVPFVHVYTAGIKDAIYENVIFANIIVLANAIYAYRIFYYGMIKAAGHFKETQRGALIEVAINIIISVISVMEFGLVGVAIGTLMASLYRLFYCEVYLSHNIMMRGIKYGIYNFVCNMICILCSYGVTFFVCPSKPETYLSWLGLAIVRGVVCFILTTTVYMLFYRRKFRDTIYMMLRIN